MDSLSAPPNAAASHPISPLRHRNYSRRKRHCAKDCFAELLRLTRRLPFEPHDIRQQLDATGHYTLPFAHEFPLSIRLFRYRANEFTRGMTWHEQLELFLPLDGPVEMHMGGKLLHLGPGDLLVLDHLKPHHVVDHPSLDTRAIVVSFLPDFVYSLGSPSHDFVFLLPFYGQLESREHLLHRGDEAATEVYSAMTGLLESFFPQQPVPYREAACKARLLALLLPLVRCFQDTEMLRWEFERQRERARRFTRLLDHLRRHRAEKLPLKDAARLCGMSPAQFTRSFKQVAGMSYVAYVTHVRLADATRLLRAGEMSIAEIADRTGFADQSHFDRRFKRAFGVTPREYQQRPSQDK